MCENSICFCYVLLEIFYYGIFGYWILCGKWILIFIRSILLFDKCVCSMFFIFEKRLRDYDFIEGCESGVIILRGFYLVGGLV